MYDFIPVSDYPGRVSPSPGQRLLCEPRPSLSRPSRPSLEATSGIYEADECYHLTHFGFIARKQGNAATVINPSSPEDSDADSADESLGEYLDERNEDLYEIREGLRPTLSERIQALFNSDQVSGD